MFSPYHAAGFYRAPVSKAVLGCVILSSVAFIIPLNQYRYWLLAQVTSFSSYSQILRFLARRLVFLDPKDVMCASILLYHFRIFDRRYGSRKFSSFLFGTFVISLMLEVLAVLVCQFLEIRLEPLPTGPYGMVFALFVPYFLSIPRVAMTYVIGVPVTGKSLTYILGLQMASGSLECTLLAACGVLSGLLYHHNWLWVQQWLCIPQLLASVTHRLVGGVFASAPPTNLNQPIGATLELQRAQHIEQLEQQMAWAQLQPQRQGGFGLGLFGGQQQQNNLQQYQQNPSPPPEAEIQRLVEMGFQRERVVTALTSTQNNVSEATNILLLGHS